MHFLLNHILGMFGHMGLKLSLQLFKKHITLGVDYKMNSWFLILQKNSMCVLLCFVLSVCPVWLHIRSFALHNVYCVNSEILK